MPIKKHVLPKGGTVVVETENTKPTGPAPADYDFIGIVLDKTLRNVTATIHSRQAAPNPRFPGTPQMLDIESDAGIQFYNVITINPPVPNGKFFKNHGQDALPPDLAQALPMIVADHRHVWRLADMKTQSPGRKP